MNSPEPFKVSWTWEEWQKSRALRRAIALKSGPPIVRRRTSSSDRRLRAAFSGNRAPDVCA